MLPGRSRMDRRCWATTTTIWSTRPAESFCRSMRRRHCSVKKHWLRDVCLNMLVRSEFTHRIWQPIKPMEVESFWLGSWHETFSRTFRLSIAVIRPKDISHESIFATSQKRMPTTAPKEKHCAIAVSHAAVGVMSIVRQKLNVSGVHRRSFAPQVPIGNYLFIGRSQRDKPFARWQVRLLTSVPNESVTRSKLYSPNSSNRSSCARYDCDDCGTLLSSSTWQPQPKT